MRENLGCSDRNGVKTSSKTRDENRIVQKSKFCEASIGDYQWSPWNVANRITIGIGSGGYNSADQSLIDSQEENEISFMLTVKRYRNVLSNICARYIFPCIFQFLKLLC